MTYLDRTLRTAERVLAPRAAAAASTAAPVAELHPELAPLLSVLFLTIDEVRSLVVNVSAARPGAGTSTVARRLAEAASATGWCRVALLDAAPAGGEPGRGLLDAIERGEPAVLTPQRIGAADIDTGRLSTGDRPLSHVDSLRKLYGTLRDRYSLVLVDCPAVLAGQQTLSVAAAADETILVVEAERTVMSDVARARAALERRGAGVLGLVMNKSRPRARALLGRRG